MQLRLLKYCFSVMSCARAGLVMSLLAMFFLQGCYPVRVANNKEKDALLRGDSFNSPFGIDNKAIAADGKRYVDYIFDASTKDARSDIPSTDGTFTERMKETFKPVKIIHGVDYVSGTSLPYAVIMRHKTEAKRYMVVFRGSKFVDDFLIDLDDAKVSFVNLGDFQEKDVRVHKGFFMLYGSLRREIFDFLLKEKVKVLDVVCHSLGCGVGFMFLYDNMNSFDSVGYIKKINFYAYGAPRCGGKGFVDKLLNGLMDSRSEVNYVNFVNSKDVVPNLPPRTSGFHDYTRQGSFGFCFTRSSLSKPEKSDKGAAVFHHQHYSPALELELLGDHKDADHVGLALC